MHFFFSAWTLVACVYSLSLSLSNEIADTMKDLTAAYK